MQAQNLLGKKFGKLLVISKDKKIGTAQYWVCKCDCGEVRDVTTSLLNRNKIYRCVKCSKLERIEKNDITGKKFGTLTVLSFDKKVNGHSKWICECDCGESDCKKVFSIFKNNLVIAKRCNFSSFGSKNYGWSGFEELDGTFWYSIKRGAKKRKLKFDIEIVESYNKFIQQDSLCKLTGELLSLKLKDRTASLDRINSDLGYTINNVWWVHRDINCMKLDLSVSEFLYWCDLVVNKDNSIYYFSQDLDIKRNKNWKGCGLISGGYLADVRWAAKRRGIQYLITPEDTWSQLVKQGGRCYLTNIPLIFPLGYKERGKQTASLDRIDSSKGYTPDNIQWVHKTVNCMKWDYTEDYFKELCKKVTDYNKVVQI